MRPLGTPPLNRHPFQRSNNQPPQDLSRATLYISVKLQSYLWSILFSKWFRFLDHTGVLVVVPGTCYYLAIAKTLQTPLKQKKSEKNKEKREKQFFRDFTHTRRMKRTIHDR